MRGQHTDIQTDRQTEPNYDIDAMILFYLMIYSHTKLGKNLGNFTQNKNTCFILDIPLITSNHRNGYIDSHSAFS